MGRIEASGNKIRLIHADENEKLENIAQGNNAFLLVKIMEAINNIERHLGIKETDFTELVRSRKHEKREKKIGQPNQAEKR